MSAARSLQGRAAAYASWKNTSDPSARTAPARAAFRDRFLDEVDPDRELSEAERDRRADYALKQYMAELARKSALARRAARS